MEELPVIKEVIENAVQSSSHLTAIIIGIVFILYHAVNKWSDNKKEQTKAKPMADLATGVNNVNENVAKLAQVLNKWINDAERKEANRITSIITTGLNSFKASILESCLTIIRFNSIRENETTIRQNIAKSVNTEYYKLYSILSNYEHESINVSSKMSKEWIDEVTNACIEIIYNDQDAISRICALDTKLNLMTGNYSVYLNNTVFNH